MSKRGRVPAIRTSARFAPINQIAEEQIGKPKRVSRLYERLTLEERRAAIALRGNNAAP